MSRRQNEILAIAEDSLDLHDDMIAGDKCPVMSFNVYDIDSREDINRIYAILSEDARVNENPNGPEAPCWDESKELYGFSLVDKFGIHWGVLYGISDPAEEEYP